MSSCWWFLKPETLIGLGGKVEGMSFIRRVLLMDAENLYPFSDFFRWTWEKLKMVKWLNAFPELSKHDSSCHYWYGSHCLSKISWSLQMLNEEQNINEMQENHLLFRKMSFLFSLKNIFGIRSPISLNSDVHFLVHIHFVCCCLICNNLWFNIFLRVCRECMYFSCFGEVAFNLNITAITSLP